MTRYFVFSDGTGQIQAVQSSPAAPSQTQWERDGLVRTEVSQAEFVQLDRNTRITITNDVITNIEVSPNAVQPVIPAGDARLSELGALVAAGTATLAELTEYIARRDRLI